MSEFATEKAHWYLPTGETFYTVKGKNGQERPTTLRDARKVGALPSVTGILAMAAKPQLQRWMIQQAVLSALTLPRIDGESSDDFLKRIEEDRQAQSKAAADRGTEIHAAIEQHYRGEPHGVQWTPWVIEVAAELAEREKTRWLPERSFACSMGYGGKVDLHSESWVVDIKTKDGDVADAKVYDEHAQQLAAYRRGLGVDHARCGILFVSRDKPQARFVEVPEDDLRTGLACFDALLTYWQHKNNYFPGKQ